MKAGEFVEFRLKLALLMQSNVGLPLYFGFTSDKVFEAELPFIYADHAYFERGYDKGNFRMIVSGLHQTQVIPGLPDRTSRLAPFPRPLKQGSDVIVIPPPKNHIRWYDCETWTKDTVSELQKHTDRKVRVKQKSDPPLSEYSIWALVGHSSVAAVEAAYMGIPVFGPETSPAYAVGQSDLSKIESPVLYDRTEWLNTLCWSQFSIEEIQSGFAWEAISYRDRLDESLRRNAQAES